MGKEKISKSDVVNFVRDMGGKALDAVDDWYKEPIRKAEDKFLEQCKDIIDEMLYTYEQRCLVYKHVGEVFKGIPPAGSLGYSMRNDINNCLNEAYLEGHLKDYREQVDTFFRSLSTTMCPRVESLRRQCRLERETTARAYMQVRQGLIDLRTTKACIEYLDSCGFDTRAIKPTVTKTPATVVSKKDLFPCLREERL